MPLTCFSNEVFQFQARKNSLWWDLTGGSAFLHIFDPLGNLTVFPATISGQGGTVPWTVPALGGTYSRSWRLTDASGITQVSRAIPFDVVFVP